MNRNDIPQAEQLLKAHLHEAPTDVPAIRMLAEVAMRVGRDEDAKSLLERALELAPGFEPARYQLAVLLHRRNEPAAALAEVERLLAVDARNPGYRNLCRRHPRAASASTSARAACTRSSRRSTRRTPRSGSATATC